MARSLGLGKPVCPFCIRRSEAQWTSKKCKTTDGLRHFPPSYGERGPLTSSRHMKNVCRIEICAGRRARRAVSGRTSANISQPSSWLFSPGGGLKSAQLRLGVSRSTSDKEKKHPMTTTNHRSHRVASLTGALCLCMLTILTGCDPSSISRCLFKSLEVVVPSADTTDPTVTLAFYLPNGDSVIVPPDPIRSTVAITQSGTVTLFARASDDQGVRDVQLWVWTTTCSIDSTGTAECKPENPQTPMASNRDASGPGQTGCTERVAPQSLNVSNNSKGSVSHVVQARGVNFGGKEVRTPTIVLKVQ